MGNKILKIALPLILVGVIAFVIFKANKTFGDFEASKPTPIGKFSFNAYIDNMIQSELQGKPYAQAKEDYRRIYDVIQTEEYITRICSDSSLLPNDSLQYCYEESFEAYWPSYEAFVDGVFQREWSNMVDTLGEIKAEAVFLEGQVGSSHYDTLTKYKAYVGDYYRASDFAGEKVRCTSSNDYENLLKKQEEYKKKYPICNNTVLCKRLDSIPGKAETAWKNNVVWSVNDACNVKDLKTFVGYKKPKTDKKGNVIKKKDGSVDYEEVKGKYGICVKKIEDFETKTGKKISDPKTDQKTKLNNKWRELLEKSVNDVCWNQPDTVTYKFFYKGVYQELKGQIGDYEKKTNKSLQELKDNLNAYESLFSRVESACKKSDFVEFNNMYESLTKEIKQREDKYNRKNGLKHLTNKLENKKAEFSQAQKVNVY